MIPSVTGISAHQRAQVFLLRWHLMNFCPGWPGTSIFLSSAFQVARIICVSHQISSVSYLLLSNTWMFVEWIREVNCLFLDWIRGETRF
jgi:hypothetical protein